MPLGKLPSEQLPTVQTPNDIGIMMGHAPGDVDWFAECVNKYGADNVFALRFVRSKRLRALFLDFLFAQDGLLHAPRASPGPTWFGQSPGQPNGGPLSRSTSPTPLMTKWRRSSPPGLPAGAATHRKTSTGVVPCAHGMGPW